MEAQEESSSFIRTTIVLSTFFQDLCNNYTRGEKRGKAKAVVELSREMKYTVDKANM